MANTSIAIDAASAARFDYMDLINNAQFTALQGCGLSDVLYFKSLHRAFADILAQAPESEREATEAALKENGFDPDFVPYEAGPGECSETGIDEDCCPCGRHP